MHQLKRYLSDAPKPLIFQVGIVVLLVLPLLWWVQQNNVNALSQRLTRFEQQINDPKLAITPKERLALEKDLVGLEKDKVGLQNGIYTTLVQALGGAFFFVTAYLTWRNVKATEEKQVTERFSKAIEQLGNDKLEVRLGGIYSLERITKDSEKDYWTIIEVLTSFIRSRSLPPPSTDAESAELSIGADIQAALTVIGRRDVSSDPESKKLDLSRANLRGADLKGANFSRADFWQANLTKANLRDANLVRIRLSEAILKEADFSRANLVAARLRNADLTKANLSSANLTEAELAGATLCVTRLYEAKFCDAKLWGAKLNEADFTKADFTGADLSVADFKGANLRRTIGLTEKQIRHAHTDENTKFPDYLKSLQPGQPESLPPSNSPESQQQS